jgi:hypothetical protein
MVPYDTAPEEWAVLQNETSCFGCSLSVGGVLHNPAKKSSTSWLNSCGFSIFK